MSGPRSALVAETPYRAQIRARALPLRRVTIQVPPGQTTETRRGLPQRIREFQRQWRSIKADLPPQLSRRHIGMISIGGVIGTGLFLGSAEALYNGGPVGAVLGYAIIGSVVYCLCVSIGEMIAFLPNVGGVVGLADLYVDPALGFSLGWASWFNWSVTLPAELASAALVLGFWPTFHMSSETLYWLIATFLLVAMTINLFPSRIYGESEFWFSSLKVCTIVVIIISSIIIDLGGSSQGVIGFKYWRNPGPFVKSYLGISGFKGTFLGFWAVLNQAAFSFFGSEVPGIAAGEVIDATRNVPRALRRVWIRITLFYVCGITCAALLVPSTNHCLASNTDNGFSSPFVIALQLARVKYIPDIINAAILLSAWSAAASDIYISSRFLFFLARRRHAPRFLATLVRYPNERMQTEDEEDEEDDDSDDDDDNNDDNEFVSARTHFEVDEIPGMEDLDAPKRKPLFVIPVACVLASASMGLLGFMSGGTTVSEAFRVLTSMASVASLLAWSGILFTYIRWHQGTIYTEKKYYGLTTPEALDALAQIKKIKENRRKGQPYLAWYAFTVCAFVLFTNGWSVFLHNSWVIATTTEQPPSNRTTSQSSQWCDVFQNVTYPDPSEDRITTPVANFLAAYTPLPVFILLTIGYKLIYQTKMVTVDEMVFTRGDAPEEVPDEEPPRNRWERIVRTVI